MGVLVHHLHVVATRCASGVKVLAPIHCLNDHKKGIGLSLQKSAGSPQSTPRPRIRARIPGSRVGLAPLACVSNHAFWCQTSIGWRLLMSQIVLWRTAVNESDVRCHTLGPRSTQIVIVGVLGPYNSTKIPWYGRLGV